MKRELGSDSTLSVVAPVFNEAGIVEPFIEEVRGALQQLDFPGRFEIVVVDDGSSDGTGKKLDELAERYPGEITVIHLARNFGQAPAVRAGLDHAQGDAVILMDADMQDDPAAFGAFLEKWKEGFDVVYAVRASRQDRGVVRLLSWFFYRLLAWMANIDLPTDAGTFALMDRRVVESLRSLPERNQYIPGLRAWVGFRQTGVPVARRARYDRKTRVGVRGLWTLAMNAIFSFSYVPMFVFRIAGVLSLMLAALLVLYALWAKLLTDAAVVAWASQLTAISFFSGINLFGIGVLGEYIARIYDEVKGRPLYIVSRVTRGEADREHKASG